MRIVRTVKKISMVFVVIVFTIMLEITHIVTKSPSIVSPIDALTEFVMLFEDKKFITNLCSTMSVVIKGISASIVVGFITGVVSTETKIVGNAVYSLVHLLKGIPAISLFPMILAIFGIGDISRIFIIFWTAMPPIYISTCFGIASVDKSVMEAAQSSGADKLNLLIHIKIPLALIEILNGIKISVGTGLISVVTAEMLGANKGIGYMILWNTNSFKYSKVYAYIFVIAIIGYSLNKIVDAIIYVAERKLYD